MKSRKEVLELARAWLQAEEEAEAAKARVDEAKENETEARDDFSDKAREYNYCLDDVNQDVNDEPNEEDDPDNYRFFTADPDMIRSLADAAEAAETARAKWKDATEETDIATDDEKDAEEAATKEFLNFIKEVKVIIDEIKEL